MTVSVVGGGLAGCEAAWALAQRGVPVTLYEMRPQVATPAHATDRLAEIVCSNSFKSTDVHNAHGLLKAELRMLGSLLLEVADETKVPAGAALAVDRQLFSDRVTERISEHSNIEVVREEVVGIPSPSVIATGPLTSDKLAETICTRLGSSGLAFYDSIAPIVSFDSLDSSILYARSRYGKGDGDDYLNAPFTEEEYNSFVKDLVDAESYEAPDFDRIPYFEGCLPIEEMAKRGNDTLRFGPMKPVGLENPKTGTIPHAVLQLRREDMAGQMWNLVGFQTRMKHGEQKRVFRTVPGLGDAEFLRLGSIHRNTYLNTPATLSPDLSDKGDGKVFYAGQLVGVEGYTESLGTGILAGHNLARRLAGKTPLLPPPETMVGALVAYATTTDPSRFQPMNANFGLLPPLEKRIRNKRQKRELLSERAMGRMTSFVKELLEDSV